MLKVFFLSIVGSMILSGVLDKAGCSEGERFAACALWGFGVGAICGVLDRNKRDEK